MWVAPGPKCSEKSQASLTLLQRHLIQLLVRARSYILVIKSSQHSCQVLVMSPHLVPLCDSMTGWKEGVSLAAMRLFMLSCMSVSKAIEEN